MLDRNKNLVSFLYLLVLHIPLVILLSLFLVLQDLQSKSKNLLETLQYIATKLAQEKREAEEQLAKMSIERSNARHGVTDIANEGDPELDKVRDRMGYCKWVLQLVL